jgi:hypothetical protein
MRNFVTVQIVFYVCFIFLLSGLFWLIAAWLLLDLQRTSAPVYAPSQTIILLVTPTPVAQSWQQPVRVIPFTPLPTPLAPTFTPWSPTATPAPLPTTPPPPTLPPAPVAIAYARLYSGPGWLFNIVGAVQVGQALTIAGISEDGLWYCLSTGEWVPVELVGNASSIPPPVVQAQPTPPFTPALAPVIQGQTAPPVPPAGNCDPSYPDVCIPPPPPDQTCDEVGLNDIRVVGADPHDFDGDHDGIGCESSNR